MIEEANITLPCGHRCLCPHCSTRILKEFGSCPLCRTMINTPIFIDSWLFGACRALWKHPTQTTETLYNLTQHLVNVFCCITQNYIYVNNVYLYISVYTYMSLFIVIYILNRLMICDVFCLLSHIVVTKIKHIPFHKWVFWFSSFNVLSDKLNWFLMHLISNDSAPLNIKQILHQCWVHSLTI